MLSTRPSGHQLGVGAVGGEGLDVQAKTHVVSRNCLLTTRLTRLESLGITGFP